MDELKNKMWAFGGGKGGVGKSLVTLMTGTALARQGKKVILIDADLGGSNLHTLAGIRYPLYTLADFLNKKVQNMEDIVIDTPVENLRLICGADDILGVANPKYSQKMRIFNHLRKLDADYILLDLGAGTSYTTMDFFLYAQHKTVVLTPQVTSIQNAYGFIKASFYRGMNRAFSKNPHCLELIEQASLSSDGDNMSPVDKLREEFRQKGEEFDQALSQYLEGLQISLLINMVKDTKEKDVASIVSTVAKKYLGLDLSTLGIVHYDNVLSKSINNMAGFLIEKKVSDSGLSFYDIAVRIANITRESCSTSGTSPALSPDAMSIESDVSGSPTGT